MIKCRKCGSENLSPYETKPPRKGEHKCDETCIRNEIICTDCKLIQ